MQRFADALAGQYELECEIGRGGMGVVYRARDRRLDRVVAIKTLPPHLATDPVVRERFLREARTAAALSHQHIVPIHRADELGGHVFFEMGYIDGESLAQRIRAETSLPPLDVLRQLADVADALGYAHRRGVIHRDVKAENILIESSTGRAMVTDFGIARLAEAAPLTATGQVLGTVYYLSPEQVAGEAVDARSDIYSLGVVGFFALAGRFPFNAELASAVLIAHVTKPAPRVADLAPNTPAVLAAIIDKCLAKDPEDRFENCAELSAALARAANDPAMQRAVVKPIDAAGASPDPLVSDTEAQAIWRRAAELQAMTGMQPRPAINPATRDAERDALRTSGFKMADVRDAAAQAGIPAPYVEHALAEHGLARHTSVAAIRFEDRSTKRNPFSGARMRVEFEVIVDGEIPADDHDLLVDTIRRELGETGTVGSVGKSFTWQLTSGRSKYDLQVSVFPRNGKTTIRVSERMGPLAGALFGGIMGGYGGGTTGIWVAIGQSMHQPGLIPVLWGANALLAYFVARGIFESKAKKRYERLKNLAEMLGAQTRAAIDNATKKLPRG